MKTTIKQIGVYTEGTIFCIEITDIKNEGTESVADVEIQVTVPDGVDYSSGNFPQGAYDTGTDKWLVGTMLPGADLTATFCYVVTDSTKGPYTFNFTISSPVSCAGCDENNQFCVIVEGMSCGDVRACEVGYSFDEVNTARKWFSKDIYKKSFAMADGTGANQDIALNIVDIDEVVKGEERSFSAGPAIWVSSPTDLQENGLIHQAFVTNAYTLVVMTFWYTKA